MASGYLSSAQLSRLNALKEKREKLKTQIREAKGIKSTSDFYLRQLQKQNLVLKDTIYGLERAVANKQLSA